MSMAAGEGEGRFLQIADVGDRQGIKRQERMAAPVGFGQSLGKIRAWAGELVEQHEEEIRTVSRTLLERRRLSGPEIDVLI